MRKLAAVKFRTASKHYYFDPDGLTLQNGDLVVVETARGLEIGIVRGDMRDVSEKEFGKNVKKIIRKATPADLEKDAANIAKKKDAIVVCKRKIVEAGLDMKLIDAEYTFDGSRLIFYFTAEKRIDFRELVKELASYFKMRIELRQIGVRDEARILGGIGSCGRELCCKGWLQDFEPVSIKMAKVQNLSLNPGKISGCCGRLMCCLKYENDIYQELKTGMPANGEIVQTSKGKAKVMDANIFKGMVKVRLIEEERTRDNPERLGSDVYEFTKDEVRRTGNKNGKNKASSVPLKREIEDALKDEIIDIMIQED